LNEYWLFESWPPNDVPKVAVARSCAKVNNFYHRFIQDFSHIAQPLYDITGNVPWRWEEKQQQAFEQL
jgi:hypothetical protein